MHHNQQIEALLFHGEYLQNVENIVEFVRVNPGRDHTLLMKFEQPDRL
jgi:hypothetical protein